MKKFKVGVFLQPFGAWLVFFCHSYILKHTESNLLKCAVANLGFPERGPPNRQLPIFFQIFSQRTTAWADPGFPVGGAPTYDFPKFSKSKTAGNWENFGPWGVTGLCRPLGSATELHENENISLRWGQEHVPCSPSPQNNSSTMWIRFYVLQLRVNVKCCMTD